jgi:hypothetical protein
MMSMGRIDAAVGVDGKIFGLEVFGGVVEGVVIEENGAENGAFGFDVGRHASDGGFESGHDVEVSTLHRNLSPPVDV